MKTSHFVAADSEWIHLTDNEGNEFSFSSYQEALKKLPDISLATGMPESDIIILFELRKKML